MNANTQPPSSADEALGRILHELGSLRSDVQSMRDQGDQRHRTIANEMAELRAMSTRALDVAAEAKRVADRSSTEMRDTQHALVTHTKGLADRQAAQATQIATMATEIASQTAELSAQTTSLDSLLAAEMERKVRDDERKRIADERKRVADARWTTVTRWWPIAIVTASGVAAAVTYLAAHWRP